MRRTSGLCLALLAALLGGCATSPPTNPGDICAIFEEKSGWYEAAQNATERWDASIPVMMAIMYQESGFRADARPPRGRLLWVIPWFRPSDAYGYPQALDSSWATYVRSAKAWGAERDDFDDAIDFVAWYNHTAGRKCGIAPTDAYRQYLAYHEGFQGYNRRSYAGKNSLLASARRVQERSRRYETQLRRCEKTLQSQQRGWLF